MIVIILVGDVLLVATVVIVEDLYVVTGDHVTVIV